MRHFLGQGSWKKQSKKSGTTCHDCKLGTFVLYRILLPNDLITVEKGRNHCRLDTQSGTSRVCHLLVCSENSLSLTFRIGKDREDEIFVGDSRSFTCLKV